MQAALFKCAPFGYLYFFQFTASFAYTIHYTAPGFEPTTTQLWVLCLNHKDHSLKDLFFNWTLVLVFILCCIIVLVLEKKLFFWNSFCLKNCFCVIAWKFVCLFNLYLSFFCLFRTFVRLFVLSFFCLLRIFIRLFVRLFVLSFFCLLRIFIRLLLRIFVRGQQINSALIDT